MAALELGEAEGPPPAETKEGQEPGVLTSEAEPDPPPDPPPFVAPDTRELAQRLEELLLRAPDDLQIRLGRLETAAAPCERGAAFAERP